MGNSHKRKEARKLKDRQESFDGMRRPGAGYKRPGSMNSHKQGGFKRGKRR